MDCVPVHKPPNIKEALVCCNHAIIFFLILLWPSISCGFICFYFLWRCLGPCVGAVWVCASVCIDNTLSPISRWSRVYLRIALTKNLHHYEWTVQFCKPCNKMDHAIYVLEISFIQTSTQCILLFFFVRIFWLLKCWTFADFFYMCYIWWHWKSCVSFQFFHIGLLGMMPPLLEWVVSESSEMFYL